VYGLARAKSRVHDRYRYPLRGVLPRRAGWVAVVRATCQPERSLLNLARRATAP